MKFHKLYKKKKVCWVYPGLLIKKAYSYFSTKTYVVGTQKNRLNETVLLSTKTHDSNDGLKNIYNFISKKFGLTFVPTIIFCS